MNHRPHAVAHLGGRSAGAVSENRLVFGHVSDDDVFAAAESWPRT